MLQTDLNRIKNFKLYNLSRYGSLVIRTAHNRLRGHVIPKYGVDGVEEGGLADVGVSEEQDASLLHSHLIERLVLSDGFDELVPCSVCFFQATLVK